MAVKASPLLRALWAVAPVAGAERGGPHDNTCFGIRDVKHLHLVVIVHHVFGSSGEDGRGVDRVEACLLELAVGTVADVGHLQRCAHPDADTDEEDGVRGLGFVLAVGGLVAEVDAAAESAVAGSGEDGGGSV